MDGFDQKPRMNRSVLVLLDFSKAYDTVWREKLLLCMKDQGIPAQMIRWLRSFLNDRRARVCLNGHLSKSYIFKQGLPQGSVLAPLLFLFYINDLAESLPEDVIAALFADDVTILSTAPPPPKGSKESPFSEAQRIAQVAVDIVYKWSVEWKLSLNAGKSEVATFSTDSKDAKKRPIITVG